MKTLIYSDVHGNLPAFEQVVNNNKDCECFISVGDLVNYGPWSNECVALAQSLPGAILLMGNHEEDFLKGAYSGTNELVKKFFEQTIAGFTQFEAIAGFIEKTHLDKYTIRHTILNKYIYPDTDVSLDDNYIIGHSHHQFVYKNNGYTLINAGSAGQNRKFINKADYLIYDSDTNQVSLEGIIYDVDVVIREMRRRKYDEACVEYYLQKARA